MIILGTIIATILSAFLYRLGGLSKEEGKSKFPWLPLWIFNTKTRDIGCSVISVLWMFLFYCDYFPWWIYLISFGATWGALTTYWDFIFGEDNFFAHGAMIAAALFPFIILNGFWVGFVIRIVTLSLFMGIWCKIFGNADIEEYGRGGAIAATLPLMLIG